MPRSQNPLTPEQRAEISRRNGAKSRGPTSAAGKERVSRNAIKHGLAGHKHIVLDDELPKAYDDLLNAYLERLDPADGVEQELVHHMAESAWRIRRSGCIETAAFNCSRADAEAIVDEHYGDPGIQEVAYLAWQEARNTLESINRYATRAHRAHDAALANLRLLRRAPEFDPGAAPPSGADLWSAERAPARSNADVPEPPQSPAEPPQATESKSDVPRVPQFPIKPAERPPKPLAKEGEHPPELWQRRTERPPKPLAKEGEHPPEPPQMQSEHPSTQERSHPCPAEPSGTCDPTVASSDPSAP